MNLQFITVGLTPLLNMPPPKGTPRPPVIVNPFRTVVWLRPSTRAAPAPTITVPPSSPSMIVRWGLSGVALVRKSALSRRSIRSK